MDRTVNFILATCPPSVDHLQYLLVLHQHGCRVQGHLYEGQPMCDLRNIHDPCHSRAPQRHLCDYQLQKQRQVFEFCILLVKPQKSFLFPPTSSYFLHIWVFAVADHSSCIEHFLTY
jgi:hypothetical protein